MSITLPAPVAYLLAALEAAGFEGYAVGGCVRDSLLGREPGDWDVATDALPEEVMSLFPADKVIPTGLRHGTVTVMLGGAGYEVTTFRVEGGYSDHRRPDSVAFTRSVEEDLSRRDFTVNAMAWSGRSGLVDPFGGREDLGRKRLACVGDPGARFREDALRILRAMRFASTLDFTVEPETAAAMRRYAPLLAHVSPERIRAELDKALLGPGCMRAWGAHGEVMAQVLPELSGRQPPDLSGAERDLRVRLAMLLPEDGAAGILTRLRYETEAVRRVEKLVRYRGPFLLASERGVLETLRLLGEEDFRLLLAVKRGLGEETGAAEAALGAVLAKGLCYRVRDLAVTGRDLIRIGVPEGPEVGAWLESLLDRVIAGEAANDREALLRIVDGGK